jgi:hypothetical protein
VKLRVAMGIVTLFFVIDFAFLDDSSIMLFLHRNQKGKIL